VALLAMLWVDKALIMASGITKYAKGNTDRLFETENRLGETIG
jgi:hypothetical protein